MTFTTFTLFRVEYLNIYLQNHCSIVTATRVKWFVTAESFHLTHTSIKELQSKQSVSTAQHSKARVSQSQSQSAQCSTSHSTEQSPTHVSTALGVSFT